QSIPNNNDNQDVVSMGTNSAWIAKKVIDNSFQVMSIHIMAICQAIDLLSEDEKGKLSSQTQKLFNKIRKITNFIVEDIPVYEDMASVFDYLHSNDLD
ncbi:MAG: histidine ammonia-lyase, partial [Planctomycetota bacterium]